MKKETVKLSSGAMKLVDDKCFAKLKFSESSDGTESPTLDMLAYSGGIIKDHWYWGDLAIDLSGLSIPKKKIPILEDHNTSLKIGFATKFSKDNNQLMVEEACFIDTPESIKFREASAQGFPYEASIYAKPSQIQSLSEGETAEVNGYMMKGPGTIWRKAILKESSICTFGYDPNTRSAAMADNGDEEMAIEYLGSTNQPKEEIMNKEKFKADHQEEYNSLVAEVTAEVEAKFSAEKAALESKLAEAVESNSKLSEENKATEKRLLALEKQEALRAEKELGFTASNIFAEKFKDSGLPERLFSKIQRLVGHDQFVKEGVLDTEAFSAAIDAELKDWATDGSEDAVHGFSSSSKGLSTGSQTEDADAIAKRMLGYVQ